LRTVDATDAFNNIDAWGAAIILGNARNIVRDSNNIKQSDGPGSPVGAVINICGDLGVVSKPVITNNEVSIFGTPTAARSIAVGNS
jgi:hypothetical protein